MINLTAIEKAAFPIKKGRLHLLYEIRQSDYQGAPFVIPTLQ